MKKVKLMLASIAVIAVIGGAFAFKAKNAFSTNVYYTTKTTTAGGVSANIRADLPGDLGAYATSYYYSITEAPTTSVFAQKTFITSVGGE